MREFAAREGREKKIKQAQRVARGKGPRLYEVSWYAPRLGRRVTYGHSIIADNKSGAVAQVKSIHRDRRKSWLKSLGAKKQLEGLTNYVAQPIVQNPQRPFFCADCDRQLGEKSHVMGDGRVVCDLCGGKARDKRSEKQQRRLFDVQKELFENPGSVRLRNIEMGFYSGGVFHPIRASNDYNEFRAGDFDESKAKQQRRLERESRQLRAHYEKEEKRLAQKFSKRHKSLSQWIRSIGGIAPHPRDEQHRGEMESLRSRGRKKAFGTSGLINKTNTLGTKRASPEYVMDAANVEGYRDEHGRKFSNIGDFLAAVADDAGGKQKYFKLADLNEYEYANPMKAKSNKTQLVKLLGSMAQLLRVPLQNPAKGISQKELETILAKATPQMRSQIERQMGAAGAADGRRQTAGGRKPRRAKESWAQRMADRIGRRLSRTRLRQALNPESKVHSPKPKAGAVARPSGRAKKNLFGFGKKKKPTKGQKRRAAKRTYKAARLEARAAYLRSLNPAQRKAVAAAEKNPGALDTAVKLAAVLGGAETAQKLLRGKKAKGPGRRPVGTRYYLFVGADRRGNHVDTKPEAVAAARSLANQTGGRVTVRKMKGPKLVVVTTIAPQVARHKNAAGVRGSGARKTQNSKLKTRNPANGSIFEDFTGTPSTQVTTGYVAADAPKNVDLLGPVVQLTIEDPKGQQVMIGSERDGTARWINGRVRKFDEDALLLCAVQKNGKRRFVMGVRADDRAAFLKKYPYANGQSFTVGQVAEVVYRARKPHLYGNNRTHTFYHILGEDGGRRPTAVLKNGCPKLIYGDYDIRAKGICN